MEIIREAKRIFQIGEIVKTRGDVGGIKFRITKVHNDYYCAARQVFCGFALGKARHFNMDVFDKL